MFTCISTLSPLLSSPGLGGGVGLGGRQKRVLREPRRCYMFCFVCALSPLAPASALQVSRLGLATRARKKTLKWGGGPRDPRAPSFCGSRARGCGGGVHVLVAGSLGERGD